MAGKAVPRPRGLTVIAILAVVQGVTGVVLALAFIGRGIELLMRGRLILGLLGLAVGALVAIGPALHLVFAWGALALRSWAWWLGIFAGAVSLIGLSVLLGEGEAPVLALLRAIIPVALICYLVTPGGRAAFRG